MDIKKLTITQAKKDLKAKKYSSVELTKAYLERIKKVDTKLNAFITITEEEALRNAQEADNQLAKGVDLPLLGIPIALKDMFSIEGIRTTAASKILENFKSPYDATVVKKLKDAGVIILGKLNCDAWAQGSSGENSYFGSTKNPWNTEYIPGGSSSGSAVSVAADLTLAALGTDTGGSVRQPAGFNNIIGIKPTYGRVSRYGVIAMASSLDTIGHMTKTVEDNAILLNVIAGQDRFDATTPHIPVTDYITDLRKGIKGLKVGVPKEYFTDQVDSNIKEITEKALKSLETLGAKLESISLPHTKYAIPAYYILMSAEVSSNLGRYDNIRYGNDRSAFEDEAKRRIILGTYVLSAGYYDAYYKKAMKVRTTLMQDFTESFKKVDVIAAPISPTLPWKFGEKISDPLKMYLSDTYTVTANLAGIPGISIPIGFQNGLPVGMQLLGSHFSESLLYQVAYAYEQENPFYLQKPKL